jgi:DNA-binding NtrC family response regulator
VLDLLPARSLRGADRAAAGPLRLAHARTPAWPLGVYSLREMVEQAVTKAEAHAIRRALTSARGNKSLAARLLHTHYTTLHTKMRRFRISAQEFRPS